LPEARPVQVPVLVANVKAPKNQNIPSQNRVPIVQQKSVAGLLNFI
jgi:hypothetical protein